MNQVYLVIGQDAYESPELICAVSEKDEAERLLERLHELVRMHRRKLDAWEQDESTPYPEWQHDAPWCDDYRVEAFELGKLPRCLRPRVKKS